MPEGIVSETAVLSVIMDITSQIYPVISVLPIAPGVRDPPNVLSVHMEGMEVHARVLVETLVLLVQIYPYVVTAFLVDMARTVNFTVL